MDLIRIKLVDTDEILEYNANSNTYRKIHGLKQEKRVEFVKTDEEPVDLSEEFIKIQDKFERVRIPALGCVIITNECNMGCSFCYAHKNEDSSDTVLDINLIKHLKTILPEESFRFCVISGGEPFLYPELVKEVRKEFARVNILTNGSLLTDDIVEWLIETDTSIYVTLDYEIPNFDGHSSKGVRENLKRLLEKYPELHQIMSLGTVMPMNELNNLDDYRQQHAGFEKDCWQLFNFIPPKCADGIGIDVEFFERELDNLEYNRVSPKESIFFRYINYLQSAAQQGMNASSCSNSITLNHRGEIYACNEYASMPKSHSSRFKSMHALSFDLSEYQKDVDTYKYGPNSLCKEDCNMKYLCGGICWANISGNRYLCDFSRLAIPYAMYIKANYIPTDDRIAATTPLRPVNFNY